MTTSAERTDSKRSSITRIAMIGNSPPRRCGIATFTADLSDGLVVAFPDLAIDLYAMNDRAGGYDYPSRVVCTIDQDEVGDYAAAAHRINESGADIVCVQHEYGIFGGSAGAHLLRLLDRVRAPVVVTLHTVLEQPDPEQRAVIEALARRAAKLVVMANRGRDILVRVHGIAAERIAVVPHGVPDRAPGDPQALKRRFGIDGHRVFLTFGLLSPNKGLETMIRAMPAIVEHHRDALYVILGATHPNLVAREGEAYRERLVALAEELGVADNVRFVDGYLAQDEMLDRLATADIYVTPYLNEAQITSGTLSLAVSLGKPVISTPYWHAAELLADGVGALVPFGDREALERSAIMLLDDDEARTAMEARARVAGAQMAWPQVARAYHALFGEALGSQPARLFPGTDRLSGETLVPPRLDAIERMTDGCGMIQHSIFSVPDRNHGYCVDDNCRALMLMHRFTGAEQARADRLTPIYAAFVQHAWNGSRGRFRNFMGFDRSWLEAEGSEDSFGRTLWALGDTAHLARRNDLRMWASHLFDQVAPHALELGSPRTWAFSILGADAMLEAHPGHEVSERLIRTLADRLMAQRATIRHPGWDWFEAVLAYDNARLPQALLRAARRLGDDAMRDAGHATLAWLDACQTNDEGQFRAVGTDSFGRSFQRPLPFDQQPLEAWAMVDASRDAWEILGDDRWRRAAWRAYSWYLGGNDLGLPIGVALDGGCFDGLMADRANLNQGAESILAFQFACCALREMAEKADRNGGTVGSGAIAV